MKYTLIIAEKPTAAKAIANALSKKVEKFGEGNKSWYRFKLKGKTYIVAPAVGHLFMLKQKSKGWDYPRFDVHWIPSFKATRTALFSKPYFEIMEKLAKDANDFIIATDYDEEGSVIGYNILRFLCNRKNARRMKFSTMTVEELRKSFNHMLKGLDMNQVYAGITRHHLDWYYGINFTRALTNALKKQAQRFKILSIGRVQGPVLCILANREEKIRKFKPTPFWEIEIEVLIKRRKYIAQYEKKLFDEKEALNIIKACKGNAIVKDIIKKRIKQKPPIPYDTSTFLSDVHRYFGISPQQALNIAEALYQKGLISYPRTNSQKLPKDINYAKILKKLSAQEKYSNLCASLLKKQLKPHEGRKYDRAHPAIYPTGELPKKLTIQQQKVYDLIVHRFLAVFGEIAERESVKVILDVNGYKFMLYGKRTIKLGWIRYYKKYAEREEVILPEIEKNEKFSIKNVKKLDKETKPPTRYSQGSIIKEMEKRGLGTQATRAQILQTLYSRGYIEGKNIKVTKLGIELAKIIKKYLPMLVSEELTREFEEKTDAVYDGKVKMENVLADAQKIIIELATQFKEKENKIGKELIKAVLKTEDEQSILGKCPKCNGILRIHKSWRTKKRFVGCSNYKNGCRFGAPLPAKGRIEATGKICEHCNSPIIQVYIEGKRPFRTCVDINCITKEEWRKTNKTKA